MNQEKGLGLQSQCPFVQKMLETAVPDHFWANFVKNVNRWGTFATSLFGHFL